MINTEYAKEFIFDIDAYLIEWYPKMNMATRRAVCAMALNEWLDEEHLEEMVDAAVSNYAQIKLDLVKAEDEDEDVEEPDDD